MDREFVGNIGRYRANTIETTRLAIEARKHLFTIAERENIAFDLERRGILHIYHDKAGFDAGLRVNTLLQQGGLDRRPVTPDEIRAIEPALQTACHGGFFTPSDATGDITNSPVASPMPASAAARPSSTKRMSMRSRPTPVVFASAGTTRARRMRRPRRDMNCRQTEL